MGNSILYVNFDGVTLEEGDDDARTNTTSIGPLAGDLQPFGGGAQPAEIVDELEVLWGDFDVAITDARPNDGDYTMVVVTPTNPLPGSLGISPVDCGNANPNNIAFVFTSAAAGQASALIARMISREVAHTFGLDDVASAADIMNEGLIEIDATFTDVCAPLGSGVACPSQHADACPGGGQNSAAELATLTAG